MSERNAKAKLSIASPSQSWVDAFTNPLTTAPSRVANTVADKIDAPSLNRSPLQAMIQGGLAGMTQGAGNVMSDMTSPANIIGMAAGPMGKVMSGMGKAAPAIAKVAKPAMDIVENIPKRQIMPAMGDVEALLGDMARNMAKIPKSRALAR